MGFVSLMEIHKSSLQALVERSWALHYKLAIEIQNSSGKGFLQDHGLCCSYEETQSGEKERLKDIRDALEVVEGMLAFLQRLQSRQHIDRHDALTRLEESRLFLIEKVTEHHGRAMDVKKEMNACFGDRNTILNWNLEDSKVTEDKTTTIQDERRMKIYDFLVSCFRKIFHPWKWQKSAGLALRFLLLSATVASTIRFHRNRRQLDSSYRGQDLATMNSTEKVKAGFLQTNSSRGSEVFNGRG